MPFEFFERRGRRVCLQVIRCRGVVAGDEFPLVDDHGKSAVVVRVVDCCHTVPTVGYLLSTVALKLKREFQGVSGKEIAAARKAGEVVVRLRAADCAQFCVCLWVYMCVLVYVLVCA